MTLKRSILSVAIGLVLAGCAGYQKEQSNNPNGYEQYIEFMSGGKKYTRCAMAYPTGQLQSSKVYLEKTVPAEVGVGKEFEFQFKVKNLTYQQLRDVVIADTLPGKFRVISSSPQANVMPDGTAQWVIPLLEGQKETVIRIIGIADQVGVISSCGTVTYDSQICATTKVVKPELKIAVSQPAQATLCDQIPITYTVSNSGSTALTGVTVASPLPDGLVTLEGKNAATLSFGDLAPGQTKQLVAATKAAKTGSYTSTGTATTTEGLTAQASATTLVRAANLTIETSAPERVTQGKQVNFTVSITNNGDKPATNVLIESQLPAGATNATPNNGGQVVGDKILWRVDELGENKIAKVSGSYRPGININAVSTTVRGDCVNAVAGVASTQTEGVGGILIELRDDPDPIEVGATSTYFIRVTNQGSAEEKDIVLTCTLEDAVSFVSCTGATNGTNSGKTITFEKIPVLTPKEAKEYTVVVKGVTPADTRFKVSMKTAGRTRPVDREEATRVY